jgi:hypothetical protein
MSTVTSRWWLCSLSYAKHGKWFRAVRARWSQSYETQWKWFIYHPVLLINAFGRDASSWHAAPTRPIKYHVLNVLFVQRSTP